MTTNRDDKPETRLIHAGRAPLEHHGAVNPPVYRTSTFVKPTLDAWDEMNRAGYKGYRYGLFATPSSDAFEAGIKGLYGCDHAVAVCSGLAAITIALTALTAKGDHILVPDSTYMPVRRFANHVLARYGVETTYYDPLVGAGIADLMRPTTTLVLTESPASLTFEVQDIPAIVAAAHARGAKVMIDNSWSTGLYFEPFKHGVDVVVEAITSYVGGHNDLLMGVLLANGSLGVKLGSMAKLLGHCCGADDLYLAQRGLRTLAVRLARSQEAGLAVARWLQTRPEVARVLHPGLPGDPGHAIWKRDFHGASGLFSIVLHPKPRAALAACLDGLRLFALGFSWGGYESLVMPADPTQIRTATRWSEPGQLLRVYAGLEPAEALIADLEEGFSRMAAAAPT